MIEILLETYGLERLMYINDISEETVVKLLVHEGLIDPKDLMFEDIEEDDG